MQLVVDYRQSRITEAMLAIAGRELDQSIPFLAGCLLLPFGVKV